ncbi:MAG: hypothetical protein V1744_02570 [Candidatus Altiarchaeota archaeon]
MKLACILDTSGILRSSLDYSKGGYGITQSVLDEVIEEPARTAVMEALRAGNVKLVEFSGKSLEEVSKAASETGDIDSLSQTDLGILAAAYEHNLIIFSDDYAIQNTAAKLGVKVVPATQDGIKRQLRWVWSCPGCGKKMEGPGACAICGHKGRKKPV